MARAAFQGPILQSLTPMIFLGSIDPPRTRRYREVAQCFTRCNSAQLYPSPLHPAATATWRHRVRRHAAVGMPSESPTLTSPRDTPRFCQSSQACLVNLSCTSTPLAALTLASHRCCCDCCCSCYAAADAAASYRQRLMLRCVLSRLLCLQALVVTRRLYLSPTGQENRQDLWIDGVFGRGGLMDCRGVGRQRWTSKAMSWPCSLSS